jgi:hypothetical protein
MKSNETTPILNKRRAELRVRKIQLPGTRTRDSTADSTEICQQEEKPHEKILFCFNS